MIPASYLFRKVYRDHFEPAEHEAPEPTLFPDRPAIDRVTAAILGFAFGAGQLALGAGPIARHDRRR